MDEKEAWRSEFEKYQRFWSKTRFWVVGYKESRGRETKIDVLHGVNPKESIQKALEWHSMNGFENRYVYDLYKPFEENPITIEEALEREKKSGKLDLSDLESLEWPA